MSICKYCGNPIEDEMVMNIDEQGNGYHHACLCEMEFRSRDRQIYNKGRVDVLDKIRAEIQEKFGGCDVCEWFEDYDYEENNISEYQLVGDVSNILAIIDKYKAESEE